MCFDFSSFAFLSLALQNVLPSMVYFFKTLHLTVHYTVGTLERRERIGIDIVGDPKFRGQSACSEDSVDATGQAQTSVSYI